jgi:hypothetical protein
VRQSYIVEISTEGKNKLYVHSITQMGVHFPEFLKCFTEQIMCGADRNAPLLWIQERWSCSSHVYSGLLLGISLILNLSASQQIH